MNLLPKKNLIIITSGLAAVVRPAQAPMGSIYKWHRSVIESTWPCLRRPTSSITNNISSCRLTILKLTIKIDLNNSNGWGSHLTKVEERTEEKDKNGLLQHLEGAVTRCETEDTLKCQTKNKVTARSNDETTYKLLSRIDWFLILLNQSNQRVFAITTLILCSSEASVKKKVILIA